MGLPACDIEVDNPILLPFGIGAIIEPLREAKKLASPVYLPPPHQFSNGLEFIRGKEQGAFPVTITREDP